MGGRRGNVLKRSGYPAKKIAGGYRKLGFYADQATRHEPIYF